MTIRWIETPRNVIEERVHAVRSETGTAERKQTVPRSKLREIRSLDEMKIETVLIRTHAPVIGATLMMLELRSRTGALVVGMRRGDRLLEKPDPTVPFEAGDVIYIVGTSKAIRHAVEVFDPEHHKDGGKTGTVAETREG